MFSNKSIVARGFVFALVFVFIFALGCKTFKDVERESIPVRPASSNSN